MKEKIMKIKHGTEHITPADGNIFLDLGFPPDEAAELLADAKRRAAEERRVKAASAKVDQLAHH